MKSYIVRAMVLCVHGLEEMWQKLQLCSKKFGKGGVSNTLSFTHHVVR